MNRNIRFLLSAALVLLFSASAFAQLFEGAITMEITSTKMPQPITMIISTKGDKSATEMKMAQGGMKIYFDQTAGTITTVYGKMGMQMPMKKIQDMAKDKSKDASDTKVVQTGETKVINGHSCELYMVTTKDSVHSNWWMTGDLPKSLLNSLHGIYTNSARGAMGKGGGPGMGAIGEMFKKGLVPIKVEMLKDGNVETTMTFVSYEQKHIDDDVFVIPSDIKIQSMPSMGGE